jgi:membrane-bound ClpP family serine protease|tara:strand:+ start:186 stop:497 length:312 start_codon:yes stop_codon:yes gene_type:complete
MATGSHEHQQEEKDDSFLNNIMKAFVIVLLTIGLLYIQRNIASNEFLQKNAMLKYLIFGFIVILFMLVMSGVQGSSFMSLLSLVIILISITLIIWFSADSLRS